MTPELRNRLKVGFMVVLLIAAAGVVYWQMQPKTAPTAAQNPPAAGGTAAPATPVPAAGAPASATPDAVKGAVQSQFQKADVDIDKLLAQVKENVDIDFDYDQARQEYPRDPLTPLVGPTTLPQLRPGDEPEDKPAPTPREVEEIARAMKVSGIVWDKTRPVAVVNNEVVSAGYEFADGITVVSIEPDRVILRIGESLIPIELEER